MEFNCGRYRYRYRCRYRYRYRYCGQNAIYTTVLLNALLCAL